MDLNVTCLNTGKGLCNKINDDDFLSVIEGCDIICICESWITPHDQFYLPGYYKFTFP